MCTCKDINSSCVYELYNEAEHMESIKNQIKTNIYHTNFPVSLNAISNFKNPLGKVMFTYSNKGKRIREYLNLINNNFNQ